MGEEQPTQKKLGATKWDFGMEALKVFWNILDRGYLLPIFIILVFGIMAVVLLRMPADQIAPSILAVLALFGSRLVLVVIFLVVLCSVVIMWRYESRLYRRECQRLGDEKSYWVHAKAIEKHKSSRYEWSDRDLPASPSSDVKREPDALKKGEE